jgi:hypothetical protein
MVRPVTLGSGEVYSSDRPIIHFGSPVGSTYEEDEAEPDE